MGKPNSISMDSSQIIKIAKKFDVDAIHPGYGFLSENVFLLKNVKMKIFYLLT